jgi:menaquinone-dependent protoporphyrinogen oxidase
MSTTLIIYSTTDGHTRKICERLKLLLEQSSETVTLVPVEEAVRVDPKNFERIVIGASIRYGRHSPKVVDFIKRNVLTLENRPSALFSVNLVARKPQKSAPDTNPYMRRFLKTIPWKPQTAAVFAGKLDYPRYGAFDRLLIRMIMWVTGGPTDANAVVEFTDWSKVDAFGRALLDSR